MSVRSMEGATTTGDGEELVELSPPGFGIGTSVLPPAEVEQDDEDTDDENGRDAPPETGPVELQPCCPC